MEHTPLSSQSTQRKSKEKSYRAVGLRGGGRERKQGIASSSRVGRASCLIPWVQLQEIRLTVSTGLLPLAGLLDGR